MSLTFPNPMRHYDEPSQLIRFSGYDGMRQVRFSLDVVAVELLAHVTGKSEASYLAAFDSMRDRVQAVAQRVYKRSGSMDCRLSPADFR